MRNSITSSLTYKAFGLGIHSALSLPELLSDDVEIDVVIRFGSVELPSLSTTDNGVGFHFSPTSAFVYWQDTAKILIRDGREIIVDTVQGYEENLLRAYVLGTVFAILLHQRGLMVLHASAVAVDDRVAVFIGNKGYGKSTTAATLCTRGHALVSDDIAAIDTSGALPLIFPAYPSFKLWPDALRSIGEDPDTLPQIYTGIEKRALHFQTDFSLAPLPVGAIFVIAGGPIVSVEPLPSHEAVIHLIRHLYMARFGNEVFRGSTAHFKQCTQLAQTIPIYKITRNNDLSFLADIIGQIESYLHKLPTNNPYFD